MKKISKRDFLRLLRFPIQWLDWEMYPDELFEVQVSRYEPGHESGSEHDRNGAFHWWLRRDPTREQLRKLVHLSFLDPDQHMAQDVRRYIAQAKNCDAEITGLLSSNRE